MQQYLKFERLFYGASAPTSNASWRETGKLEGLQPALKPVIFAPQHVPSILNAIVAYAFP